MLSEEVPNVAVYLSRYRAASRFPLSHHRDGGYGFLSSSSQAALQFLPSFYDQTFQPR